MKIIINADDFGINKVVTSEIAHLIERGLISSTTIMANGECLDEVKSFARKHSGVSFGIHLCLSEFNSLTKSPILHKYGITDEDGIFIKKAIFKIKTIPQELRIAIENELCAQLERVLSLGIKISHADSHHHVHTIPVLVGIFDSVLNRYCVRRVRIPQQFYSLRSKLHLKLWIENFKIIKTYKSNYKTVDLFCSYDELSKYGSQKYEVVELMCHPGHPSSKYINECNHICNNTIINNEEFKLISYNEL